jgi:signal transduction histidine kinase
MVLARLRLAIYLGLPVLPAGALMNALYAPDRLGARLAGFGFLTVAYTGMLCLSRWPRLVHHPQPLAVGFMLTLGAGLLYLISLSPSDLDVLTGPVTCVMIGSTLLFPWGAVAQLAVSGTIALAYGAFVWPHVASVGMRAVNVATSLGVSAALSVVGALILEKSRRTAFAERHRVRALAVQRRRLIEIGRDLRSTLNAERIAPRLIVHAERLIRTDAVLLAVADGEAARYRFAAASDPALQNLVGIEVSDEFTTGLLRWFPPAEVREVPGSPLDDLVMSRVRPFGFRGALIAVVGPHPRPAGFIAWMRRTPEAFTRSERLTAIGIADQVFTALSAARLYEDAAHASRLKTEFVSTMSHELRTPLNVIMGYNQILNETLPPDPETVQALDAVRRASNELLDLVDATLDLGRIETGRESVREETVAVRDLFDELAREFASVPRSPGVALVWDAGEKLSVTVDRRKLKTVLKNLAGNALKFTPAGSVRVECRRVDDRCRFRVIDTGIGIHPQDQSAVFDMFRQADSSDSRRYGGTGLGLYIVRQLVRLLAGQVTLESAPGRGSTFTVTIPLGGASGSRQRSAA